MIHLSYNGELYSYDNKITTTVSADTNIPITIHPYEDIEGAKLYYKQNDTEGIVDITNNVANIPGAYLVTGDLQVALRLASSEMSNFYTLGVTVISSSGDIMDDDIQFTMDNKKRLILVPGHQTLLAIQFDNQSEIVTFKLPKYQEGVDLSTKVPYVNYRRPQVKDLGKALCTIEQTTEDTIYITWMVDATATQYDGVIQFQVEFADSDGYRWQSQIGEIPILASLYNTGLEPYTPDILEQYLNLFQSMYIAYHMPPGGTTGQVLKKSSNEDYDAEWGNESGGGGSSVTVDDELSPISENPVQNKVVDAALKAKAPLADISKNLIVRPYSRESQTVNGVTFTVNDDGTITANGTATSNATFVLRGWTVADGSLAINPKIRYRLTGSPAGASTGTYFMACRTYTATQTPGSTTGTVRRDTGNGATWSGASYVSVYVGVISGQTVNNLVFSPMLTYDGVDDTYDEYGESVIPYLAQSINDKLSADQGIANAGKFMIVGNDGVVTPVVMSAWQGGSY